MRVSRVLRAVPSVRAHDRVPHHGRKDHRPLPRGEVSIAAGSAGQTKAGVILCGQVRTVSLRRLRGSPVGLVLDPEIRAAVRHALTHHLGLDVPAILDEAA